jgi:hypothetical protein
VVERAAARSMKAVETAQISHQHSPQLESESEALFVTRQPAAPDRPLPLVVLYDVQLLQATLDGACKSPYEVRIMTLLNSPCDQFAWTSRTRSGYRAPMPARQHEEHDRCLTRSAPPFPEAALPLLLVLWGKRLFRLITSP